MPPFPSYLHDFLTQKIYTHTCQRNTTKTDLKEMKIVYIFHWHVSVFLFSIKIDKKREMLRRFVMANLTLISNSHNFLTLSAM